MELKPGVTVYCLAFNHADYIGQTLQGFLDQETDFPFHVIVHDDCSTDNTRAVIERYVAKRPEMFTTIFQEENQFSKMGIGIIRNFIYPQIETEYTCTCEGDDYWSDPHKLQLQYDYMQAHPECSMCVHNTACIAFDGTDLNRLISTETTDRDYTADDVISSCGHGLFHTSSHLYRTQLHWEMPDYYRVPGVGDYPQSIYLATRGYIHYIARTMSAYRMSVPGSWSDRVQNHADRLLNHLRELIIMLESIDLHTGGAYHTAAQFAIDSSRYPILIRENRMLAVFASPVCRDRFREETTAQQCKLILRWLAKPLMGLYRRLLDFIYLRKSHE